METDVQSRWCWGRLHIVDLFHVLYMSIRQFHAYIIIQPLASRTASQGHHALSLIFSPLSNTAASCYYVTAVFMCPIRAACVSQPTVVRIDRKEFSIVVSWLRQFAPWSASDSNSISGCTLVDLFWAGMIMNTTQLPRSGVPEKMTGKLF